MLTRTKQKLKPHLLGLPGPEIKRRKDAGEVRSHTWCRRLGPCCWILAPSQAVGVLIGRGQWVPLLGVALGQWIPSLGKNAPCSSRPMQFVTREHHGKCGDTMQKMVGKRACLVFCGLQEIQETHTVAEVAFTGDTTAEFITASGAELVLSARLLIMELTFLDDNVSVEKAQVT